MMEFFNIFFLKFFVEKISKNMKKVEKLGTILKGKERSRKGRNDPERAGTIPRGQELS
jgi:hypothetical protein